MARNFVAASSQYLELTSAVLSAVPISMACWARSNNITAHQVLMALEASGTNENGWALKLRGDVAGDPVEAWTRTSAGAVTARTTSAYAANTWLHACAVFAADNDRRVYLNGGSKDTNATSRSPSGVNRTEIGRAVDNAAFVDGRIAEAAIWNAILIDEEVAALARGTSPLGIRPRNLVAYWPLYGTASPEQSFAPGAVALTVVGASRADHAPVAPSFRRFWRGFGEIVGPNQTITPTSIPSSAAFGTPKLNRTVAPASISSSQSFGTPGLSLVLTPASIPSGESLGSPRLDLVLVAVSSPSSEAFGTPAFGILIQSEGVTSDEAFGSPTVMPGQVLIQPPSIPSTESFGTPKLTGENQVLQPGAIPSSESFGALRVSVLGALIEDFAVEFVDARRVRISWCGTAGKYTWIVLNGKVVAGPLEFGDSVNKSYELNIPSQFRIEIHEGDLESRIEPIGDPLERFSVVHWTRVKDAARYHIYRRRDPEAAEERIASVRHVPGPHYFEHQTLKSQRQDDGCWNLYRVAAVNEAGTESAGESFPFFIPGLPKPPKAVQVSGPANALVVTLEV